MRLLYMFLILFLGLSSELVVGIRLKKKKMVVPVDSADHEADDEIVISHVESVAFVKVQSTASSWKRREMQRSHWSKETKWRVCGLHLSFNYGAYWITGFSKAAIEQGGGNNKSSTLNAETDCEQRSRFTPNFRIGMRLIGYPVAFQEPPTADTFDFSWILPVAHVDKRDPAVEVAQIGKIPHSHEYQCCQAYEVTMRCFQAKVSKHCTIWIHFRSSSPSCQCAGKMIMDLCNFEVTMDEAMRAQLVLPDDEARKNDVKVQFELSKRKSSEKMAGFRLKLYPEDKDEQGDGETYSLPHLPTLAQLVDFAYEYSARRQFYYFTTANCQHFAAWMLSKATNNPSLNIPYLSFLPTATL